MQEGKVVVWGGAKNSWGKKRSERQGRKGRYTQQNAAFQRIARRNENEQWKPNQNKTEKNNRKGKTKDLFKKTGDKKGIFQVKMGLIKPRDTEDLTEAKDIEKRWQEHAEELYQNPKRWCCQSVALSKSVNLENWAVDTGVQNVSFHFNLKKGQCQRMLKQPYRCSNFTC